MSDTDFVLTPDGPFYLLAPKSERAVKWARQSPIIAADLRPHVAHGWKLLVEADYAESLASAIRRDGMNVTWVQ